VDLGFGRERDRKIVTASSDVKPAPKRNLQLCYRGRTMVFTLWICAFVTSHQLSPVVLYIY
jgi:hypothetical protein